MKRFVVVLAGMILLAITQSPVFADVAYLTDVAYIEALDPMDNGSGKKIVRFTFQYSCETDMWHPEQVMFCSDARREGCDGNVPIHFSSTNGLVRTWDVPLELIQWGQSGMNWANDADWFNALWLGIPDCRKLRIKGKNLVIARSLADPQIPKSGGAYLLYVGPGAPYVPGPNDVLADGRTKVLYTCQDTAAPKVQQPVAAKPAAPVAAPKAAASAPKTPDVKKGKGVKQDQNISNSSGAQGVQAAPSLKIKGNNNRAAQSAPTNVTKGAIVTVDKMSAKDCKEGTVDADGKCLPNIQANTTSTTYQLGPFVFGSEPVKTSVGRQGKVEVEKDGSVEFEYGDGKGSRDAGINAPPPSAAEKQAGKKKQ